MSEPTAAANAIYPETSLVCDTCRVLVVLDDGRWVHPAELREKFSRSVCDDPRPGRPAKGRELRYGRGTQVRPDKWHAHLAIDELDQAEGAPVVLATDGSYKLNTDGGPVFKPMGWGYVATNGIFGLGAATISATKIGDRILQAELRAIWWPLRRLLPAHPVTLLVDSQDAIELIQAWRSGRTDKMPPGYSTERASGRYATLVQLSRLVHERADVVEPRWVRGHTGHPLNEGADQLAKLGRAWANGRSTDDQVKADARVIALRALVKMAADQR